MVTLRSLVGLVPAAFAALLFAAVAIAEGGVSEPGWSVSSAASGLTAGCLLLALVAGLVPKRRDVRIHASVVMAVFAVTALGQSRMLEGPNAIYRVGVGIFTLLVIVTWRAPQRWATRDAEQRPVSTSGRGIATALLVAVWALVTAALVIELPRASHAVERRMTRYFEGYHEPDQVVGFSSNLDLGATRGMLQSNKVVMRIEGPPVDYLRGAVLDDYDAIHQRWSSSL
ncbi:MAG: hypothetical protein JWP97_4343, partial [Labilithrix sp.]|nr:hypothetical protein [Labilithrix sp.]